MVLNIFSHFASSGATLDVRTYHRIVETFKYAYAQVRAAVWLGGARSEYEACILMSTPPSLQPQRSKLADPCCADPDAANACSNTTSCAQIEALQTVRAACRPLPAAALVSSILNIVFQTDHAGRGQGSSLAERHPGQPVSAGHCHACILRLASPSSCPVTAPLVTCSTYLDPKHYGAHYDQEETPGTTHFSSAIQRFCAAAASRRSFF